LIVFTLIAPTRSFACATWSARNAEPSATTTSVSAGECSRRSPSVFGGGASSSFVGARSTPRSAAVRARARRRVEPDDDRDDRDLDDDAHEALPEEDRARERHDAVGDDSSVRDYGSDRRLQRVRRRHLERRRTGQALRPNAP
jgi:hypothetical protein